MWVRVHTDTSGILMEDADSESESLFLGLTTQLWSLGRSVFVA